MIDEERPCAAHNKLGCWCLKNDARVRTSTELSTIRSQLNPQPIPAPTAPATSAAQSHKE